MNASYKLIMIGIFLLVLCAFAAYLKGGSVEYVVDVFRFEKIELMSINIPVGYVVLAIGFYRVIKDILRE